MVDLTEPVIIQKKATSQYVPITLHISGFDIWVICGWTLILILTIQEKATEQYLPGVLLFFLAYSKQHLFKNIERHPYLLIFGVESKAVLKFHMVGTVMERLHFTHTAVLFRSLLQNTGPYKAKSKTKE